MKAFVSSIIHIVSGKAGNDQNHLAATVNELMLQQVAAGRKASVWQILPVGASPVLTGANCRSFIEQSRKFAIDPELEKAILEQSPSAVFHLHGGMNPVFYGLSAFLKKQGISFVFTPHDSYEALVLRRSGYLASWYFRFYEKKVLNRASAIHCITATEAEGLRSLYPNSKTIEVPHGYRSACLKTAVPSKDKLILGFCGSTDIFPKGLDLLINAFAFVKQVNPRAELWIIGESSEQQQLSRRIQSRGLSEDVHLFEGRSPQERSDLLSKLTMLVDPARSEGMPFAVIEAAAMGVPCVVSHASNISEAVKKFDCGEVVVEADETELFNAIMNLKYRIDLDGATGFGNQAKAMVASEFNWNVILPRMDSIYQVA